MAQELDFDRQERFETLYTFTLHFGGQQNSAVETTTFPCTAGLLPWSLAGELCG